MTLISHYPLLVKMQEMAQQAAPPSSQSPPISTPGFQEALQSSLSQISSTHHRAQELMTSYQQGQDVSLAQLMIAQQESSLAFSGAIAVRNKFVQAYQEIMNMPL